MEHNRKLPRSTRRPTAQAPALELPPERAFVVHLDAGAEPPRRVAGRIEHVTSGRVAHVTCLDQLMSFMAKVLDDQARGDRRTVNASLAEEPEGEIAHGGRGSLAESATGSAPHRTLRGRKGGTKS